MHCFAHSQAHAMLSSNNSNNSKFLSIFKWWLFTLTKLLLKETVTYLNHLKNLRTYLTRYHTLTHCRIIQGKNKLNEKIKIKKKGIQCFFQCILQSLKFFYKIKLESTSMFWIHRRKAWKGLKDLITTNDICVQGSYQSPCSK